MAVIYGWTYANAVTYYGWDSGVEATYIIWENHWAKQVDSIIFTTTSTGPLTDADEVADAATIVNELMIQTGLWLKSRYTHDPLDGVLAEFPSFTRKHWLILEKYARKYREEERRIDGIRVGVDPDNVYFRHFNSPFWGGL
jgi:hypothetical protein